MNPWALYIGMDRRLRAMHWTEAVAVLSLDSAVPFFADIGLTFRDPRSVQMAFREIVLSLETVLRDLGRWGEVQVESAAKEALVRTRGAFFLEQFDLWLQDIFEGRKERVAYTLAIADWARSVRNSETAELALGQTSEQLCAFYWAGKVDVEPRIEFARKSKLSPWDEYLYALCKFSNDAELVQRANDADEYDGTVMRDPCFRMECCVEENRFSLFWEHLIANLDESQLDALFRFASRFTKHPIPQPSAVQRRSRW